MHTCIAIFSFAGSVTVSDIRAIMLIDLSGFRGTLKDRFGIPL